MKKSISIFLCLALILSSCSFIFATPTSWDTSDQSNLQGILRAVTSYGTSNLYYYVSQIYSLTNTISNNINTIKGYLIDGGHSVAYWVSAIDSFMSPILNAITALPVDISSINEALWFPNNGSNQSYLSTLRIALTNQYNGASSIADYQSRQNAHYNLLGSNGSYTYAQPYNGGLYSSSGYSHKWQDGTPLGNIALLLKDQMNNDAMIYSFRWGADLTGYNSLQSLVSFADPDSTVTFTPQSATDGIYKYLNALNTPLARLGYVLASDSRIEAQEADAANEQAVVDNFIDSSGDGAIPTSSFSDVSGLSSGVSSNLSTDASPAQIWDIFNSDHGSWFSQETANQLDTTTRTRRSEFETPLLDQQMEEIYKSLGGGK